MSTQEQIKANQQNAQKSTGPQTAQGKAVVSQNAVKHGIFAAEAVITGENPADYEAYHDQFLTELLPVGMMESMLAERVISLGWRLRRAERMQNQAMNVMIARIETNPWEKTLRERTAGAQDPRAAGLELLLGWATNDDFSNARILDRLLMYERRIENSMHKTMKELKRFQVIRRIEIEEVEKQQSVIRPAVKKGNLKKQSQYIQDLMSAKSYMQGDYGNNPTGGDEENKPNQSQLHESVLTKGAVKREKSPATATG